MEGSITKLISLLKQYENKGIFTIIESANISKAIKIISNKEVTQDTKIIKSAINIILTGITICQNKGCFNFLECENIVDLIVPLINIINDDNDNDNDNDNNNNIVT